MTASPGWLGQDAFWVHQLGRLVLLQGMLLGLVAGVGGMALPLITCGDAPPDGRAVPLDQAVRVGHVVAAMVLVWSFWIEIDRSAAAGLALRALVMAILLVGGARIWRVPRRPGPHRWLIWIAAWMIPLGYLVAALFPEQKRAGMHAVFIGGFALLGLSVALHVALAHGDEPQAASARPWQVPTFGALLLAAVVLRGLVEFDPSHFYLWLGVSSGAFLAGSAFWGWLAIPAALRGSRR